jgi:hypothetical protein
MHRDVLLSLAPWLLVLIAACAALWLTARVSGAHWRWRRLQKLHACEAGSVQSLSFVLTLPVFMMIVLFIVQVSQFMIAKVVVHYAAFAAARSAIVWLPARTPYELPNQVDPEFAPEYSAWPPVWDIPQIKGVNRNESIGWGYREAINPQMKFYKIWAAAVMACAPISPSRQMYPPLPDRTVPATYRNFYASLAPAAMGNPRIPDRIENKLSYAGQNTIVQIQGIDRDSRRGPTYNPYPGYYTSAINPNTGEPELVWVPWKPYEIGWEDAMTITVTHDFALLPGIGKLLAIPLGNSGGANDRVSSRIERRSDAQYAPPSGLYTTKITATVTLSNEGLKSLFPYEHPLD